MPQAQIWIPEPLSLRSTGKWGITPGAWVLGLREMDQLSTTSPFTQKSHFRLKIRFRFCFCSSQQLSSCTRVLIFLKRLYCFKRRQSQAVSPDGQEEVGGCGFSYLGHIAGWSIDGAGSMGTDLQTDMIQADRVTEPADTHQGRAETRSE